MAEFNEEKQLEGFTGRALRRNKAGSYEQLLCQHLIQAVNSPPAQKIRLICEAAYMIPETPDKTDKINREDLDLLYKVATSFSETRFDMRNPEEFHGAMLWAFPLARETVEKYVMPWLDDDTQIYLTGRLREEVSEKLSAMKWGPDKIFKMSQNLHIAGFAKMEAVFTSWAMPKAMILFESLAKQVNPDTYQRILEVMH